MGGAAELSTCLPTAALPAAAGSSAAFAAAASAASAAIGVMCDLWQPMMLPKSNMGTRRTFSNQQTASCTSRKQQHCCNASSSCRGMGATIAKVEFAKHGGGTSIDG